MQTKKECNSCKHASHTATPWELLPLPFNEANINTHIALLQNENGSDAGHLSCFMLRSYSIQEANANAVLVINAVNGYHELKAQNLRMKNLLQSLLSGDRLTYEAKGHVEELLEVLEKKGTL